jgi:UDP-N-acetyl-D-glucosamine dehydrogenase
VEDTLRGADCAVFVVDHDVFKGSEMEEIKELMKSPIVVDCKNMFDKGSGIVYQGIGKGD